MTDTGTKTIYITDFPAEGKTPEEAWHAYHMQVIQTADDYNVQRSCYTAARAAEIDAANVIYLEPIPVDPGAEPQAVEERPSWFKKKEAYQLYKNTEKMLKRGIVSSLKNEDALATVRDKDGTFRSKTVSDMLHALDLKYSELPEIQYYEMMATLDKPYLFTDKNYAEHCAAHLKVHETRERVSTTMDERTKYDYLRKSFNHVEEFEIALTIFDNKYPLLGQKSFQLLATDLLNAAAGPAKSRTTADVLGGAYMATIDEKLSALQAKLSAAEAKVHTKSSEKGHNWCHTHGYQNTHGSSDCNRRGPNHNDKATADNKMGGETGKWVEIKRRKHDKA